MTTRYRVSDHPPPDLQGRPRPDRLVSIVAKLLERTYVSYIERTDYNPETARRNPDSPLTLVLAHRRVIASDDNVAELTFRAPDGGVLPPWQPGCHLDFHLPSGRRRQYSLCGSPADTRAYSVAVRRIPDGGGGSREMHDLAPGAQVQVRGPRNGFPFVPEGPALFIAGGIGITPIIAMVRAARALGLDWQLVYCGRITAAMPFLDEIASWEVDRVTVLTDTEHGVPTASDLLAAAPAGGAVYCCGPAPMLDLVRTSFAETSARSLHFERFTAPPVIDGRPFAVELARSGGSIDVAADTSALAAIRAQLPDVAYSCQQGFCGTCKVKVIAGQVDHRENRLSGAEQADHMLICVSRAANDKVVLDL